MNGPRRPVRVPRHESNYRPKTPLQGPQMTPQDAQPTPLAQALGRIPCGLFLATTQGPNGPMGFIASFVQQMGFEPPTIAIAVGKDRDHLEAIRASGRFGLSLLDKPSSALMGRFFGKLAEGETPFDGQALHTTNANSTVFTDALAWFDCRLAGEHETGDHIVVFGVVEEAAQTHDGDPMVHLRADGLSY